MQASFDNKINLLSAHIRSSVDDSILYSISTTHNLWGRTVTLLKDANPAPGSSPIVGAIYWRERLFMVHGHRKPIDDIKRKTPGFVLDAKPTRNGQHRRTQSQVSKKEDVKAPSRKLKGTNDKTEGQDRDSKRKRSKSVTIASPPIIASPLQQSFVPLARNPSVFLNKVGLGNWWRSMSCITRYWRWASDRTEYEMTYHHEHWKALTILDHERRHHSHHEKNTIVPKTRIRCSTTSAGRNSSGSDDTNRSKHQRSVSFSSSPSTLSTEKVPEDDLFGGTIREEEDELEYAAASLSIPYRNHLFHKNKSPVLHIQPSSLLQDEVFLILVFIYSETKRQDKTNSSGGW
ncbi:hypothetical protein AGABI1DRAFT_128681 [Agaricus bisporus var. burnettii JB137-S8]|uniref:Uncharacterized protein n=1 Tax=Agaricus bisporus var. burnettii (strain JB137-S8 / ATCC MYA-4627 / FGSC 10392) TaxID=597362 RepID=K5VYG5_AGABU|nr:uncharacterized protein AGABI1DRAFT_128681 [Agaricus bisporus var. burnettii JB137-S8]EKM79534.1 hypothetical protein AGABI1DRAFT_128681 [Agaricus bisporus var. burnettii JB137-S8]